jgi:hypothetical protein
MSSKINRLLLGFLLPVLMLVSSCGGGSHSLPWSHGSSPSTPWVITQSKGMPDAPTMVGTGFYFDFTTDPLTNVNYVQWKSPPNLVGATQLTVHFKITGGCIYGTIFRKNSALTSSQRANVIQYLSGISGANL